MKIAPYFFCMCYGHKFNFFSYSFVSRGTPIHFTVKLFILEINISEKLLVLWLSKIHTHTHIFSGLKNRAHFQSHQIHIFNIVGRSNTTLCSSMLKSRAIILKLVYSGMEHGHWGSKLEGKTSREISCQFYGSEIHKRLPYHEVEIPLESFLCFSYTL